MNPRRRAVLVSLLVLATLACPPLAAPLAAQEAEQDWQPIETFDETVSVDVVNVEVWVTDRQGRPVTGLSREDFELYEDGRRVPITHFAAFEPPAADPADAEAPPRPDLASGAPRRAAPAEPVSEDSRLHLAVFVDNWNLRPADRARVFQDLREFLRTGLSPEDRVMIAVHDRAIELVQDFTADPEELEASLERIGRTASGALALAGERRSALAGIRQVYEDPAPDPTAEGVDPCRVSAGEMENFTRHYAASVQAHAQRSGGALASVSEILAGVPGRKVLLYVGSGLAQQAGIELFQYVSELCPNTQSSMASHLVHYDLTWLYDEVVRRANAHGVTFYTLDARAPGSGEDLAEAAFMGSAAPSSPDENLPSGAGGGRGPSTPSGGTFRPSAGARRVAELDQQGPLVVLARETGGRAILNAARFREDFDRLATDLRTYYSLGFAPEHQGDGELHRLEVKVIGERYGVRHRRAYLDKPFELKLAERIRGAAQFGVVDNPLEVRAETGEATPWTGRGHRVPVRIWVPLEGVTLLPGETGLEGRLRVVMAVSDAAGNLGPVRQKLVPVTVGLADREARRAEQLVEVNLELAGDFHVVALAVRDEIGGDTSYLRHEVRLASSFPEWP